MGLARFLSGVDRSTSLQRLWHIPASPGSFIPADYQEAATIEGANPFQIYWQIYLPLARPALIAFAFLVIQWSWNEFLWALIITSRTEMQVLSVGIALLQGQYFSNNALLMAAANMATIPVLILFLVFQRQLVEGITLSGLK